MGVNNMNPDTDKVYSVTIKGYIILDEHEDAPDWTWDITKLVQAIEAVTIKSTQLEGFVLEV